MGASVVKRKPDRTVHKSVHMHFNASGLGTADLSNKTLLPSTTLQSSLFVIILHDRILMSVLRYPHVI